MPAGRGDDYRPFASTSVVWQHFLRSGNKQSAKCKHCGKVVSCAGGSTSGMARHAGDVHGFGAKRSSGAACTERLQPRSGPEPSGCAASVDLPVTKTTIPTKPHAPCASGSGLASGATTSATQTLMDGFVTKRETLEYRVSRMCASDGLSFNTIASSKDIRDGLVALGHKNPPTSHNTVKAIVRKYANRIREVHVKQLAEEIRGSPVTTKKIFTLTLDEWTDNSSKRYLNVVASSLKKQYNMGLVKLSGSVTSAKTQEYLQTRISAYGLSMDEHISACTTDGASVMVAFGRLLSEKNVHHQQCFAHGLHLAVLDTLCGSSVQIAHPPVSVHESVDDICPPTPETRIADPNDDSDPESEDEGTQDTGLQIVDTDSEAEEAARELDFPLKDLVASVRSIVKVFRRPKANETLQQYVRQEHGKQLNLILDIKTRWNSTLHMLKRFAKLYDCIQKALIDLKHPRSLCLTEVTLLKEIIDGLTPVESATRAICRSDANLITADAAIKFLLDNLDEKIKSSGSCSTFLSALRENLVRRLRHRRTERSTVLRFLHDASYDFTVEIALGMPRPTTLKTDVIKNVVFKVISQVGLELERQVDLDDDAEIVAQDRSEADVDDPEPVAAAEDPDAILQAAIQAALQEPKRRKLGDPRQSTQKNFKQELSLFRAGAQRGILLEGAYVSLLSIKPTSVDSERAFSAAAFLKTKFRCRLSEGPLDDLCVLRGFFKSEI
jgi:hypothetical protein